MRKGAFVYLDTFLIWFILMLFKILAQTQFLL